MDSVLHRDLRSQHFRRRLDRPNTTKRKMKMLILMHQLVLFYNYFHQVDGFPIDAILVHGLTLSGWRES